MNVLETLDNELKGKELSELYKLRYLYIRCCQLFHFDARYAYSDLWKDGLAEEIKNRKIDLTNVTDNSIICHTFSREVLAPVIREFTSLEPIVCGADKSHSVVGIKELGGENWILDGTSNDLQRLKMNMYPTGMTGNISNSYKSFKKMDKALGFDFVDEHYYHDLVSGSNKREQFRTVGFLLSDTKDIKKSYSDSNFFFNKCTSFIYCDGTTYLDRDYNFHKLVVADNGKLFYDLSKDDDCYSLKEIDEDRYEYLTRTLKTKPRRNNNM